MYFLYIFHPYFTFFDILSQVLKDFIKQNFQRPFLHLWNRDKDTYLSVLLKKNQMKQCSEMPGLNTAKTTSFISESSVKSLDPDIL